MPRVHFSALGKWRAAICSKVCRSRAFCFPGVTLGVHNSQLQFAAQASNGGGQGFRNNALSVKNASGTFRRSPRDPTLWQVLKVRRSGKSHWERRCSYGEGTSSACTKVPHFGSAEDGVPRYCKAHKHPNDVNVTAKNCVHPKCRKRASFGFPGSKARLYCKDHHDPEHHVNLNIPKCTYSGCERVAYFGKPGASADQARDRRCRLHRHEEDVDLWNPSCGFPDCATRASYREPGIAGKYFCAKHKCDWHVLISSSNK